MNDKLTIEVPFTKNTPEVAAALQAIAAGVSAENLIEVHKRLQKHGPEVLNKKLKTGLGFI